MRTVVVGGGFIAQRIASVFMEAGSDLELWVRRAEMSQSLPRDLTRWVPPSGDTPSSHLPSLSAMTDRLALIRPDHLILAAGGASVPESITFPLRSLEEPGSLCARTLEALRLSKVPAHFCLISSAAIYGRPGVLPVPESLPPSPISPYGYAKWMAELTAECYSKLYGIRSTIARPFSIYGEGQKRLLVWEFLSQILAPATTSLTLQGSGTEVRDFLHVRDLAEAILRLCQTDPPGGIFNIGSGIGHSTMEVASLLLRISGRTLPIVPMSRPQSGHPEHWVADITRLRAIGYSPKLSLEAGLTRLLDWGRKAT